MNFNKLNRKANMTMFVVFGAFLLIVILAFAMLQMSLSNKEENVIQSESSQSNQISAVTQYINECISKALSEGLIEIGEQGGVITSYGINTYSNGIPFNTSINNKKKLFNVTYGLTPFGRAPNYPLATYQKRYLDFSRTYPLGIPGLKTLNQIKSDLKIFVVNYTQDCVNFDIYNDTGIYVKPVSPLDISNVNIDYGATEMKLNIKWPIDININKKNYQTNTFSTTQKVRLDQLYNTIYSFMDEERLKFTHRINMSFIDPYKTIAVRYLINKGNSPSNKYDNIVVFTDMNSKVYGKPLEFYTAIQNRRPALQYISKDKAPKQLNIPSLPNVIKAKKYDYAIYKNEVPIIFNLSADDPDEDYLLDDQFKLRYNFSCCNDNCTPRIINDLKSSNQSSKFVVKSGQYTEYCVNVSVYDEANLSDYQDVNIIVLDTNMVDFSHSVESICSGSGDLKIKKDNFSLNIKIKPESDYNGFTLNAYCGNQESQYIDTQSTNDKTYDKTSDLYNNINSCSEIITISVKPTPISSSLSVPAQQNKFQLVDENCNP